MNPSFGVVDFEVIDIWMKVIPVQLVMRLGMASMAFLDRKAVKRMDGVLELSGSSSFCLWATR